MQRLLRRLMNLLLLPVALLMVVLEDVVWAGALAVLRGIARLAAVQALQAWLRQLSGYAALPLFLIPEIIGLAGKLWAIGLLAQGHTLAAVQAYVLIRLGSTVIAVFIYQCCAPALLRIGWFAWIVGRLHVVRDWAVGLVRPLVRPVSAWLRAKLRRGRGRLMLRWLAIRRWLARRRA